MKALIVDSDTMKVISLVFMQSEGWKREVYLSEKITNLGADKLPSFIGVFIVSATQQNIDLLKRQLADPVFKEYHIFFTTSIDETMIKYLAECDTYNVIKNLYEIFMDYQAITPACMTLGFTDGYNLSLDEKDWPSGTEDIMMRTLDGFAGMCVSLRKSPMIKYLVSSKICWKMSSILQQRLTDHKRSNMLDFEGQNRSLVLITDRKEDPMTPLMFGWTYMDMLHEVLGMNDNRISTKKTPASGDKKSEYNLNVNEDEFYRDNLFANYGEVATNVKKFLEKVSQNQKTKIDIKNFDDMQMAMNSLPELRKESGNASKHVDLITELTKDINSRQLLNISMLEQDIATKDNKTECYEVNIPKNFPSKKTKAIGHIPKRSSNQTL
jgi:vacuolar protein sorting-associated protein 45